MGGGARRQWHEANRYRLDASIRVPLSLNPIGLQLHWTPLTAITTLYAEVEELVGLDRAEIRLRPIPHRVKRGMKKMTVSMGMRMYRLIEVLAHAADKHRRLATE